MQVGLHTRMANAHDFSGHSSDRLPKIFEL